MSASPSTTAAWQYSMLFRRAEATHAIHDQAQQHSLQAVGSCCAKVAVYHIFGISGKIRARAPERTQARPTGQRLEATHGAAHNGLDGICAMESPPGVQAWLKCEALFFYGRFQRLVIRSCAFFLLLTVLDPLDSDKTGVSPLRGIGSTIKGCLFGSGQEHVLLVLHCRQRQGGWP